MWRDSKGVVYVEFLLVFPPLLLLFLFILQSAIIRASDIGVRHAASSAVRSAIVVLPDDPIAYNGQKKDQLEVGAPCSDGFVSKFNIVMSKMGVKSSAPAQGSKCPGGPRLEAIRFAAVMRMLPFSPNPQSILPESMRSPVAATGQVGWLAGAAVYSYGATAVSFPKDNGSKEDKKPLVWTNSEPVTVRVSYLAHCGIPIARFFMCDSGASLWIGEDTDMFKRDLSGTLAARKRLKGSRAEFLGLKKSTGSPNIFKLLLISGERFLVLSADATLPLNSAPYTYKVKGQ